MSMVSRALEKTSGLRPGEIPLGKALMLILFMALPGKLTTKTVRFLLGLTGKLTGRDLYRVANVVGPLVAALEAYGFNKWRGLKSFLGPTGTEYLALGTIAGAIDAGFERETITEIDKDLSDVMSDAVRNKIVAVVRKFKPAGFPEAGTSGWREQQRWLASPQKLGAGRRTPTRTAGATRPTRTSGPRRPLKAASPEKPIDWVQQTCEVLAAKSRM